VKRVFTGKGRIAAAVLFALVFQAVFFASCGNTESSANSPELNIPEPVKPGDTSGLTLSLKQLNVAPGKTAAVTANKAVTWTSSNANVAAVDENGNITGKKLGGAIITAATADGKTAICAVSVIFSFDNVTPENTFTINSEEDWNAALAAISEKPDGILDKPNVFKLEIMSDISIAGKDPILTSPLPTDLYPNHISIKGENKGVLLTGNHRIRRTNNLSILMSRGNQAVVIDGPTLDGEDRTDVYTIMYIGGGAVAELRNGAITGGNQTNPTGWQAPSGTVEVWGTGTFIMNGGKIINNKAFQGGGVYSTGTGATVMMNGGEISGNTTTTTSKSAGGVYVDGGNFFMTGGTISGNSANHDGSGDDAVATFDGGKFTKYGGVISPTIQ
jgi:hypothetical protein